MTLDKKNSNNSCEIFHAHTDSHVVAKFGESRPMEVNKVMRCLPDKNRLRQSHSLYLGPPSCSHWTSWALSPHVSNLAWICLALPELFLKDWKTDFSHPKVIRLRAENLYGFQPTNALLSFVNRRKWNRHIARPQTDSGNAIAVPALLTAAAAAAPNKLWYFRLLVTVTVAL